MTGDVRDIRRILNDLGYRQVRSGSHEIFEHDHHAPLSVAMSPSDRRWRANMLAELRRRHPEAPQLARPGTQAPVEVRRARRQRNRRRQTRVALAARPADTAGQVEAEPIEALPNPGSPEAVAEGCTCPVFANRRGAGRDDSNGLGWDRGGIFEVHVGCPLHYPQGGDAQ